MGAEHGIDARILQRDALGARIERRSGVTTADRPFAERSPPLPVGLQPDPFDVTRERAEVRPFAGADLEHDSVEECAIEAETWRSSSARARTGMAPPDDDDICHGRSRTRGGPAIGQRGRSRIRVQPVGWARTSPSSSSSPSSARTRSIARPESAAMRSTVRGPRSLRLADGLRRPGGLRAVRDLGSRPHRGPRRAGLLLPSTEGRD